MRPTVLARAAALCAFLACPCAVPARAAGPAGGPPPVDASPRLLFYRGLYREIALGDLEAAIASYRALRAAAQGEKELAAEALIREGICLEKLGRDKEALSCYDRAIAQSPDSTAVVEKAFSEMAIFFSRPAMVHARDKDLDKLKEEAARCLKNGDQAGARDRFRTMLLIDPDNHDLQLEMASVCKGLGEYRDAALYYVMATGTEKYGNDPAVLSELASCYRALDDHASAIKLWRDYLGGESLGTREQSKILWEIELLLEASECPDPDAIPRGLSDLLAKGETQTREGNLSAAVGTYYSARSAFATSYLPPLRLGVLCDYLLRDAGRDSYVRVFGGPPQSGRRQTLAASFYESALKGAPLVTAQRLRCRLALLYEKLGDMERAYSYIAQYFSKDFRPVENDGAIMERIRKKRERERVRRLREKP